MAKDAPSSSFSSLEGTKPSLAPLLWLCTVLAVLIGLWELWFDLFLEVIEFLFLVLVEAPEEFLEDRVEDWLKIHYPYDATRYSEIITAIGFTPAKIILGCLLLVWLTRSVRYTLFPKTKMYVLRQVQSVSLAWKLLAWPYKILLTAVLLGVAVILL